MGCYALLMLSGGAWNFVMKPNLRRPCNSKYDCAGDLFQGIPLLLYNRRLQKRDGYGVSFEMLLKAWASLVPVHSSESELGGGGM